MEDPSNFDEKARSFFALEDLGPVLAAEAGKVLAEHPGVELAGLIAEGGTIEFALLQAIRTTQGHRIPADRAGPGRLMELVSRDLAQQVVDRGPADLRPYFDAIIDRGADTLPVAVGTKHGIQCAGIDIPDSRWRTAP